MRAQIHHVALNVGDLDWYVGFFENVFGMTIQRTRGEKPERQVWFREGIQLNESADALTGGNLIDHFSLGVDDIPSAAARAIEAGCTAMAEGPHWVALPNGARLELKPLAE